MTERRLLQAVLLLLSLSPLGIGGAGMLLGPGWLKGVGEVPADLDSHFRYLSGIFFGLGLALLTCVPRIESMTVRFRWIAVLVVIGGLARLLGLVEHGVPGRGHVVGLGLELVVTPLLVLWQHRVAGRRAATNAADTTDAGRPVTGDGIDAATGRPVARDGTDAAAGQR